MAKFVEVHSPGPTPTTMHVNIDRVTFVRQSRNDARRCAVHFDHENTINIGISAEEFLALAEK